MRIVRQVHNHQYFWGDFRNFGDVGGRQEALKREGDRRATTDRDLADLLVGERIKELEAKRHRRGMGQNEPVDPATLGAYATEHLKAKKRDGDGTDVWLGQAEHHLKLACCTFFGDEQELRTLRTGDMDRFVAHLRTLPSRKGGMLTATTIRKVLNSLSNLFARAVSNSEETGAVSNPVREMFSKPTPQTTEASYLSPEEAALLLDSARTYKADAEQGAFQWIYPLLATHLLTGGRRAEVLGLLVDDVSLSLGKVYFRPNVHRRLKTDGSTRIVPLWPQLAEILRDYFQAREQSGGLGNGLLFPAVRTEKELEEKAPEKMLVDLRKPLGRIAMRAGFDAGDVKLHQLRYTYTAARLQTCDRGRPIALYTAARELGHRGTSMIEKRYRHLHDRTQEGGSEVVEFRIEHHREKAGPRLEALSLAHG